MHEDLGALGPKAAGERRADAGRRACDQDRLAGEIGMVSMMILPQRRWPHS